MSTRAIQQTPLLAAPLPDRCPRPRYALGDLSALAQATAAAIDCETDDPHPMRARLTHVAFATDTRVSGFVRADAGALRALAQLARSRRVAMHNALYDLVVLARHGVGLVDRTVDCTRILSHLFDEHAAHDLKNTADRLLRHRGLVGFRDLPPLDQVTQSDRDALMAAKGRVDCEETLEVLGAAEVALQRQPLLASAYRRIERPLLPVFASITLRGVTVDEQALRAARIRLAKRTIAIVAALQAAAGVAVDPTSDEDVARWLYERLGLTPAARTPGGRGSTSRKALAALRHPAGVLVLEARAQRARVEAIDRWLAQISDGGRFHPLYTAWSRPNAPISLSAPLGRTEEDPEAPAIDPRPFVRAADGHVLLAVTLDQLRLRWLAHVSADPLLGAAFDQKVDPATVVADRIAPGQADLVPAVRAWLEALCSGDGPRAVARRVRWRQKDAMELLTRMRDALPLALRMADHLADAGRRRGWIQTPLGRQRRYNPRYLGRAALADLLEVAETDTVKVALRALWDRFGDAVTLVRGLTVLLEVPAADARDVAAEARAVAAQPPPGLRWTTPVDVGVGATWKEATRE